MSSSTPYTSIPTLTNTSASRTTSSRAMVTPGSASESPDAPLVGLAAQRELRQRHVIREVLEHDAHALADRRLRHVLEGRGVGPDEVADDAQPLVGRRHPALLVELDE